MEPPSDSRPPHEPPPSDSRPPHEPPPSDARPPLEPPPSDSRRRRPRPLVVLVAAAVLLVVVLGAIALAARHDGGDPGFTGHVNAPQGDRRQRVTAWLTSTSRSLDAAFAAHALDEVDCDWYTIGASGTVSAGPENLALVKTARDHGVQAFATVTNRPSSNGSFTSSIARAILGSAAVQRRAVDQLVALATGKG